MKTFEEFKHLREVITGRCPADLLITNVKLVNVFTQEIIPSSVEIAGKYIANISNQTSATILLNDKAPLKTLDGNGAFLVPSFIDAHMHIEDITVTPDKLNDALLPHGVKAIVADPHEVTNVAGKKGLEFIINSTKNLDLEIYINLPSCVPAAPLEESGANLKSNDLKKYYENKKNVKTLAEVMDLFAVEDNDDMLEKLYTAYCQAPVTDGHGCILDENGVNLFTALNVKNDHECTTRDEVILKLQRGMTVFLREGSVAKNLIHLLPTVTEKTYRNMCFCTDDTEAQDLAKGLCVTSAVRLAIENGLDPIIAITMASLNPSEHYHLQDSGAIAPGFEASFFMCDNLTTLVPNQVFQKGTLVAENGKIINPKRKTQEQLSVPKALLHSVHIANFTKNDLRIPLKSNKIHVIQVIPGNFITEDSIKTVNVEKGFFIPSPEDDLTLMCYMERHKKTGHIGKCVATGFKLKAGAIASSVAHDAHNIICIGMNEDDMELAIKHLKTIEGGYCVVANGKILADRALPICGLLGTENVPEAAMKQLQLEEAVSFISDNKEFNPFQMLSFLALPVIPDTKLTTTGLCYVPTGTIIPLEE